MEFQRRRRGLIERLRDGSTPTRVVAALGLVGALLLALSWPALSALTAPGGPDFETAQLRLGFDSGIYGFTAEGLRRYIDALQQGEETRLFLTYRAPLDLLLPLTYGPALMMLALSPLRARAARRKLAPPSALAGLAVLPLLAAAADGAENMALVWLLVETAPGSAQLDPIAEMIALTATPLKFALLIGSCVLIALTRLAPDPFFSRRRAA